jgi:hypothetical protein
MRSKHADVMSSIRCLELASMVLFQVYVGVFAFFAGGAMVEQSSRL